MDARGASSRLVAMGKRSGSEWTDESPGVVSQEPSLVVRTRIDGRPGRVSDSRRRASVGGDGRRTTDDAGRLSFFCFCVVVVVAMEARVDDATRMTTTTLDDDFVVVDAEAVASAIRAHAVACYEYVAFASSSLDASPESVLAAFARARRELARGGETSARRRMRRRWARFVSAVRCGGMVARVAMHPMTRRAVVLAWVCSGKATPRSVWGMW